MSERTDFKPGRPIRKPYPGEVLAVVHMAAPGGWDVGLPLCTAGGAQQPQWPYWMMREGGGERVTCPDCLEWMHA